MILVKSNTYITPDKVECDSNIQPVYTQYFSLVGEYIVICLNVRGQILFYFTKPLFLF